MYGSELQKSVIGFKLPHNTVYKKTDREFFQFFYAMIRVVSESLRPLPTVEKHSVYYALLLS